MSARSTKSSISIAPARLRLQRLELLALDHDVLARRELVALHDVLVGHFFAGRLGHALLPDPRARSRPRAGGSARPSTSRRRHELHRHAHQAEPDRAAPDGSGHRHPPPLFVRPPDPYSVAGDDGPAHLFSSPPPGIGGSVEPTGRRRRDRGPPAAPVEPRQGPLPRGRLDQSPGHRLLRPGRADDAPPPRRPPRHHGPLARRGRREVVLREALPAPRTRVGPDHRRRVGPERLRRRRAADARVDGEPGRARAPHPPGPRRRPGAGPTRSSSTSTPAPAPPSSTAAGSASSCATSSTSSGWCRW